MRLRASLVLVLVSFVSLQTARAQEVTSGQEVEGLVLSSQARWTGYRNAIITESMVLLPDGREIKVWQSGGRVKGISMWQSHAPALLHPGDRVRMQVAATRGASVQPASTFSPTADRTFQVKNISSLESFAGTDDSAFAAYVQTENPTGAALYWPIRDFELWYDSEGVTTIVDNEEFVELDKAFATWQTDSESCGVTDDAGTPIPAIRFVSNSEGPAGVGNDGLFAVKFHETFWGRELEDGMMMEYNDNAAGLTTLFFVNDEDSKRNGEIVDADIEFNGVHFTVWREGDTPVPDSAAELGNTATHEIGHFLGLDHTCWDGAGPRRETSEGQPVPPCSPQASLTAEVTEATMYNFQDFEETKKKTLEDGEREFICAHYQPFVPPPGEDDEGGCCRVAEPKAGTFTQMLFGLGFTLLGVRQILGRRRRTVARK
jgi:hypothetical protein